MSEVNKKIRSVFVEMVNEINDSSFSTYAEQHKFLKDKFDELNELTDGNLEILRKKLPIYQYFQKYLNLLKSLIERFERIDLHRGEINAIFDNNFEEEVELLPDFSYSVNKKREIRKLGSEGKFKKMISDFRKRVKENSSISLGQHYDIAIENVYGNVRPYEGDIRGMDTLYYTVRGAIEQLCTDDEIYSIHVGVSKASFMAGKLRVWTTSNPNALRHKEFHDAMEDTQ